MAKSLIELHHKRSGSNSRASNSARRGLERCLPTGRKHIRVEAGDHVAEFEHGFCAGAEADGLLKWVDALLDAGETLKDGDTCYVSRARWNEGDVVVKRYNHKGFVHSLRHTMKKSRARKAWLYAHYLAALGIATPKPLAYIEHRKGSLVWQSYLLTEYVEGQRLWSFLRNEAIDEQQRLDGMRQVVEMLDRLWQHHITHGDLKHTNVLITESGPVLTDLDGMMFHRWGPLYKNKQAKDIDRFLKKTDVSPELRRHCRELVSSKTNSGRMHADVFDRVRIGKWTARVRKGLSKSDIRNLLPGDDSPAECPDEFTQVESSDYARVFRGRVFFDGANHTVYLKRYLCRSRLDLVKHLFRPSRARRAFNASLMLRRNGFTAPAVVGLFERRVGPFRTGNSLLTEEVANAMSMVELLTDMSDNRKQETIAEKRSLIAAFARTVGQMHARGIFHGDLRLGNVLVVKEDSKWRFFLIDNERTKKFVGLPARLRVKNLVQINMFRRGISNSDRLRFFSTYLSVNPSLQVHYARWAEKIIARTEERLSRKDWPDD